MNWYKKNIENLLKIDDSRDFDGSQNPHTKLG